MSSSTAAAGCLASVALAQDNAGLLPVPDYSGEIGTRAFLSGDWGGVRREWAEQGAQIAALLQHLQQLTDLLVQQLQVVGVVLSKSLECLRR